MNYIKSKKATFLFSIIYVSIGTLSVCSIYPKDYFYGNWSLYGILFTFPVSIISAGYRYADANSLFPVFIIQTIMAIITFLILRKLNFKWLNKNENINIQ